MISITEKQLDELTASMISQMQAYIDEWRSYSESSIDMPANKAEAMEIAQGIVHKLFAEFVEKQRRVAETLNSLNMGNWVESKLLQEATGKDFSALIYDEKLEHSRTVEWNKPPLNGQKIRNYFRLKSDELRWN